MVGDQLAKRAVYLGDAVFTHEDSLGDSVNGKSG
jgi:hypothetical protein